MDKLKGWRTIALQIVTMIGVGLQSQTGFLSADQLAFAMTVIAALNMVLRFNTNTPVGGKAEPPAE